MDFPEADRGCLGYARLIEPLDTGLGGSLSPLPSRVLLAIRKKFGSPRLLEMATRNGARALGMPELGVLAPGKTAALAYAEADAGLGDPEEFIVSGEARLRPVSA